MLRFELEEPIAQKLVLKIEDNDENIIVQDEIKPGNRVFEILIADKKWHPGRYYWRLKADDQFVMGMFFIGKNLNPYES